MLGYTVWQVTHLVGRAILAILLNPVTYIVTVLLIWDLLRNVKAERRFFGVRVTRVWKPLFFRYMKNLVVGVVVSFAALALGLTVTVWEIVVVSGLSVLLACVRLRGFATPYAVSLCIVLSITFRHMNVLRPISQQTAWNAIWHHVIGFHIFGWVGLLALMYFAEAILFVWNPVPVAPVLFESRRGRSIGGFVLQFSYLVPIGVWTPGFYAVPHLPSHWPWLSSAPGISLMGLPVVLGFGATLSTSNWRQIVKLRTKSSLVTALTLSGVFYLTYRYGILYALLAVAMTWVALEWYIWRLKRQESLKDPLYVARDEGVFVLCTIKGSAAEQMGLAPGDCITHVNQVPVHTAYDLHFALDQNPAYAKLQVVDSRGEIRLVGTPVYAGERHRLGLITVPERNAAAYQNRSFGLLQSHYLRYAANSKNPSAFNTEAPTL